MVFDKMEQHAIEILKDVLDHAVVCEDHQYRVDSIAALLALYHGTTKDEEISKAKQRNRSTDDGVVYE